MRKAAFFSILFFYFLAVFQNSFLAHYQIKGSGPNLVLIFIILFSIFEKKDGRLGFWAGLTGGLYLDMFSPFWFGLFTFLGLASVLLIKIFKPFFEADSILSFLVILILVLCFYYGILILADFSGGFYFNLLGLSFNLLAGIIIYSLFRLAYVFGGKRIKK